jgi:hypothetical protein
MTFGDDLAPRLILETVGQSHLSFGVKNQGPYSSVVIVEVDPVKGGGGMSIRRREPDERAFRPGSSLNRLSLLSRSRRRSLGPKNGRGSYD